jgi:hypothetical protein
VSDLIDPISGDWDIDLLNDLFGVVDVHIILQIPLHRQGFDDFIAWSETKHGRYIVWFWILPTMASSVCC